MKELQEILKKVSQFAPDEKAILATVVDVVGSGYRRAGARMLIDKRGAAIGTVSGGCLEADVLERAKKVLETNEPTVITYDTTKDETSLFGLGMGCRGIVRVLLEPIEKTSFIFKSFKNVIENREKEVVATLVSSENFPIGGRIFYNRAEQFSFHNLPECFETLARLKDDCRRFYDGETLAPIQNYETESGAAEFFIEKINPPINLWLFGAGYDAIPLIKFAKEIGWRVCVIDHRAAFANAERLSLADEIIVSRAEDLHDDFFNDENSVAVVMTHNFERDREILPRILRSNCRYIGALGPKKRAENILDESGKTFSDEQLKKLYAPIGLDIGADTPEEIALAIIAEIRSVLANRNAGFLRERQTGIH